MTYIILLFANNIIANVEKQDTISIDFMECEWEDCSEGNLMWEYEYMIVQTIDTTYKVALYPEIVTVDYWESSLDN